MNLFQVGGFYHYLSRLATTSSCTLPEQLEISSKYHKLAFVKNVDFWPQPLTAIFVPSAIDMVNTNVKCETCYYEPHNGTLIAEFRRP